jgi:hypothetical protein
MRVRVFSARGIGMSRGRARASRTVARALALAFASAPAAEAAKKRGGGAKLKTAKASATAAGPSTVATATATCAKGTRVVSGGYTTSAPELPNHWLNVFESQRVGPKKWRVSGAESFAGSDTLTAYAYCQRFKGKIKARSARVALPTTASASAVAQAICPARTKAISGGFSTEAPTGNDASYVSRSIAAFGNRWVVDATRLEGSAPGTLNAHVYCADLKVKNRSANAAVVGPANATVTATTPKCPKRMRARGGGFATSTPVAGLMNAALVYETRRAGAVWRSSAAASSGTTSITLQTGAYCS